jgi:hypothetical protein
MCAGDIAVAGLVGVDLLDYSLGDGRSSWREWPVAHTDARGTATARAVGDNLHLVGHSILRSLVVGVGPRYLAVCWFVVDALDSGDGDW